MRTNSAGDPIINWNAEVNVDGEPTRLHDWLQRVYLYWSDTQIAEFLIDQGLPCKGTAIRAKRRREGWSKPSGVAIPGSPHPLSFSKDFDTTASFHETIAAAIKNNPQSILELSEQFDRSPSSIQAAIDTLKAENYNIVEIAGRTSLDTKTAPRDGTIPTITLADLDGMTVRLGVLSDPHAGSACQQITAAHKFIRVAYKIGVRNIIVPGDVVTGERVYQSQQYEIYAMGSDNQVVAADYTLLRLPGLRYYLIGGNHDYSYIRSSGTNVVKALARQRDDIDYLGFDLADLALTDRADVRLWHPSGGVPYAVSYRLQKALEQMAFEQLEKAIVEQENPNLRIVLAGHLHIRMTMGRGPITGVQCGAFEGQTNYLKRKGVYPDVGGYLLTIRLTDSGLVQRFISEWVAFTPLTDDYLNHPDLLDKIAYTDQPEIPPIFEWVPDDQKGEDLDNNVHSEV